MPQFKLDQRLQNDTVIVSDKDDLLCLLMNDQRYLWLILVPKQAGLEELHDLPLEHYNTLMGLSRQLGQELMAQFDGHKLNVAAIGNVVRQLHLHHVVRRVDDSAWPSPVWGMGTPEPYTAKQLESLLTTLRQTLTLAQ